MNFSNFFVNNSFSLSIFLCYACKLFKINYIILMMYLLLGLICLNLLFLHVFVWFLQRTLLKLNMFLKFSMKILNNIVGIDIYRIYQRLKRFQFIFKVSNLPKIYKKNTSCRDFVFRGDDLGWDWIVLQVHAPCLLTKLYDYYNNWTFLSRNLYRSWPFSSQTHLLSSDLILRYSCRYCYSWKTRDFIFSICYCRDGLNFLIVVYFSEEKSKPKRFLLDY